MNPFWIVVAAIGSYALVLPIALGPRIAHTDPSKYRPSASVHGGAGKVDFTSLYPQRNRRKQASRARSPVNH